MKTLYKFAEFFGKFKRGISSYLSTLNSYQILSVGFLSYLILGMIFISLPIAQKDGAGFVDNLFNIVSAMSTTGLTTGSVADIYSPFGLVVLLILMQLGAVGYMTISSFIILARFNSLSYKRVRILSAEFPLPKGMRIGDFIVHIIVYTAALEIMGTLALWWEFSRMGIETPLWSAVFHSVSSFATAGFSIYPNSLEGFKDNLAVNATIAFLCYAGAIGFIVPLDVYHKLRGQTKRITFTTKVIIVITLAILVFSTLFLYFSTDESMLVSFFQVMSASTTAGFNTVPISSLPSAALMVMMVVMIIGASPSGTGGGVKTTSLSVIIAVISSVMSGEKEKISLMGNIIPPNRIFTAIASITTYAAFLFITVLMLSMTEKFSVMTLSFEASSALGTVGLSTGITAGLSTAGKLIITFAMFVGRVGPLALGLSMFFGKSKNAQKNSDIAV